MEIKREKKEKEKEKGLFIGSWNRINMINLIPF
jgi:hypothetical protein